MPCQATPRERISESGWTCTGDDLVIVLRNGEIPVVAPAAAIDAIMAGPLAKAFAPEPYLGGDHLHLVIDESVSHTVKAN